MSDHRVHPRAPIELKVAYQRMNAFFADYTRDISKGGIFIKSEDPMEIGTEFSFQVTLPRRAQAIALKGRVMWVNKEGGGRGMGIQFVWDRDEDRKSFEKLVEDLMKETFGETLSKKLVDRR
jgi:type IV pilus assembly protein PilZ